MGVLGEGVVVLAGGTWVVGVVVGWGVGGVFVGRDGHGVFGHLGALAQGSAVGSAIPGGGGVEGVVGRVRGDARGGHVAWGLGGGGAIGEVGVVAGHGGGGVACGKARGRVG